MQCMLCGKLTLKATRHHCCSCRRFSHQKQNFGSKICCVFPKLSFNGIKKIVIMVAQKF